MRILPYAPRLTGLIATAVLGTLASGVSAVAAAADAAYIPTETVKYGDLKVSSAEGAAALYARIRSAARRVCASFDQPLDPNSRARKAGCMDQAIAKGVAAVNEPALFAVYKANGGTSTGVLNSPAS